MAASSIINDSRILPTLRDDLQKFGFSNVLANQVRNYALKEWFPLGKSAEEVDAKSVFAHYYQIENVRLAHNLPNPLFMDGNQAQRHEVYSASCRRFFQLNSQIVKLDLKVQVQLVGLMFLQKQPFFSSNPSPSFITDLHFQLNERPSSALIPLICRSIPSLQTISWNNLTRNYPNAKYQIRDGDTTSGTLNGKGREHIPNEIALGTATFDRRYMVKG